MFRYSFNVIYKKVEKENRVTDTELNNELHYPLYMKYVSYYIT